MFARRDYVHPNFLGVKLLSDNFTNRLSSRFHQQNSELSSVAVNNQTDETTTSQTATATSEETPTATVDESGMQNVTNYVYKPLPPTADPV